MGFPLYILASAKEDFRQLKTYIRGKHGDGVWADVNRQFKTTLHDIAVHPLAGVMTEEALSLGLPDIRQRLVGQTRVIYQFDGTQIHVHMFISTRRDFLSQLAGRLLR